MMKKSCWLKSVMVGGMGLFLCGCAIKQQVQPVQAVPELKSKSLCIIEDAAVRKSFLDALVKTLQDRGFSVQVVNAGTTPVDCPTTISYTARWSWDLRIYMSYAKVSVSSGGKQVGEAVYDSRQGGLNLDKFINAEEKVKDLVDQLFPK